MFFYVGFLVFLFLMRWVSFINSLLELFLKFRGHGSYEGLDPFFHVKLFGLIPRLVGWGLFIF